MIVFTPIIFHSSQLDEPFYYILKMCISPSKIKFGKSAKWAYMTFLQNET